ncbi:apolipoprotein N-acyltransferase [Tomitella biformata]|uniref:apolipoprotein N-acyltransferase n=1 Tax=Tomitella biformata TaxID=630403 RepID=UPI0004640B21|nr:apolipoprotein N-acyltransferase [Tomitella biformata]
MSFSWRGLRDGALHALPRQLAAVAGGLLIFAGFPPRTLWFLAPVGITLIVLAIMWPTTRLEHGASAVGGFGYGYLAGLGFLVPLLPWVGVYVGAAPWLALAAVEALFIALFGLAVALVNRHRLGPLWLTALALAACWSLTEWLRSSVPFGGFPWGKLAFGQSEGWLLPLASVGGAPLLSFAVALIGAAIAIVVVAIADWKYATYRPATIAGLLIAGVLAPLGAGAASLTLPDMDSGPQVTVAAIQGNVPRLGLEFNAQRRAVLDMHIARTLELAADIRSGRSPQPSVVVWPENSSDIDPLRNPDANVAISAAAAAVNAPILVGAVLVNGDGTTTNSVIVWDPVSGPGDRHDKGIIQPFGEYLPYRDFFRKFSSYADSAGNFVPGDDNGVVTAAGLTIGVATCYEVAFDRALTTSVRDGAQFLAVPTNNATFGDTEMTYQQLAMSRVRAVEHGRATVVAATSGVSAIISPNGTVTQKSELFVPAALVADIPLRQEQTLATRLGPWPEYALIAFAGAMLLVGAVRSRLN